MHQGLADQVFLSSQLHLMSNHSSNKSILQPFAAPFQFGKFCVWCKGPTQLKNTPAVVSQGYYRLFPRSLASWFLYYVSGSQKFYWYFWLSCLCVNSKRDCLKRQPPGMTMESVGAVDRLPWHSHLHHLTFGRVEFHIPPGLPNSQSVKVPL